MISATERKSRILGTSLWRLGLGGLNINDMERGVFLKSHCLKCAEYGSGEKQITFPNRRLLPIGNEPMDWIYRELEYYFADWGIELFQRHVLPILKGHEVGYIVSEEDCDLGYKYMSAMFSNEVTKENLFLRSLKSALCALYHSSKCGYRLSFNVSDVINTLRQCDEMIEELRAEGRDATNWDLPF